MPSADGAIYDAKGTFAFISCKAFRELEQTGVTIYDGITWRLIDRSDVTLHVKADIDRTEMWIKCDDNLPLVLKMRHNPLGIDWTIDE
jgi:hypothetical protein